MNTLKGKFSMTLLIYLMLLIFNCSNFYAAEENVDIGQVVIEEETTDQTENIQVENEVLPNEKQEYIQTTSENIQNDEILKASQALNFNEFNVNFVENGFYFDVGQKRITAFDGSNFVFIKEGDNINEYYFSEKFVLSENKVVLSNLQYNLLVNNIENSNARRIRIGKAIDRVNYRKSITIYSDEGLTKPLTSISIGNNIKLINTVLDGKLKVLTNDGREGFVDTRFIRILNDNLPPHIYEFDIDSNYIITISQDKQNMKVYLKNQDGTYGFLRQCKVSTGRVNEHTPNGIFKIKQSRGTWFTAKGGKVGAKYFVQFKGNYLLHSTLFTTNQVSVTSSIHQLGNKVSSGCIRLPLDDANWVFNNIPAGTLLIIDNHEIDLGKLRTNKNI